MGKYEVARYWRNRNRFRIEGIWVDGMVKVHRCNLTPQGAWLRGKEQNLKKAEGLRRCVVDDHGEEELKTTGK